MTRNQNSPLPDMAALQWLVAMGADEVVGDTPIGFYNFKQKTASIAAIPVAAKSLPDSIVNENRDYDMAAPVQLRVATPSAPLFAAHGGLDAAALAGAAMDLAQLRAAIDGFQGLAIKSSAAQTVFSDGNPSAKIMLIGEAPGAEEDRIGKPFVGPAGQLLDKMLSAIQLDRSRVYISNILFWRPPANRTPSPEEMAMCMPFVRRHIALVRPQLLVCLGGVAMKAMFDVKDGIMKLRGTWMDFAAAPDIPPIPTLLTYHPAFLLRTPAFKKDAWADLQDLQKRAKTLGIVA